WEGTQTGPLAGPGGTIPPSGKRQVTRAAFIATVEQGRIKDACQYFDMMTLLQQLGAAPQQPTAHNNCRPSERSAGGSRKGHRDQLMQRWPTRPVSFVMPVM